MLFRSFDLQKKVKFIAHNNMSILLKLINMLKLIRKSIAVVFSACNENHSKKDCVKIELKSMNQTHMQVHCLYMLLIKRFRCFSLQVILKERY